jgi:hypothetical protein
MTPYQTTTAGKSTSTEAGWTVIATSPDSDPPSG